VARRRRKLCKAGKEAPEIASEFPGIAQESSRILAQFWKIPAQFCALLYWIASGWSTELHPPASLTSNSASLQSPCNAAQDLAGSWLSAYNIEGTIPAARHTQQA
jgi:hypothetical protein